MPKVTKEIELIKQLSELQKTTSEILLDQQKVNEGLIKNIDGLFELIKLLAIKITPTNET